MSYAAYSRRRSPCPRRRRSGVRCRCRSSPHSRRRRTPCPCSPANSTRRTSRPTPRHRPHCFRSCRNSSGSSGRPRRPPCTHRQSPFAVRPAPAPRPRAAQSGHLALHASSDPPWSRARGGTTAPREPRPILRSRVGQQRRTVVTPASRSVPHRGAERAVALPILAFSPDVRAEAERMVSRPVRVLCGSDGARRSVTVLSESAHA